LPVKSDLNAIDLKDRITISQLIQSQFELASLSAQSPKENFNFFGVTIR
jgi:hypothetical protein